MRYNKKYKAKTFTKAQRKAWWDNLTQDEKDDWLLIKFSKKKMSPNRKAAYDTYVSSGQKALDDAVIEQWRKLRIN